jgi:uncharacterized peroxidase-related enzyme
MDPTISEFPVPKLDELPKDIQDRIHAVQDKAGFVPNIFLALAHRPDEFRAFFAYHDALMEKNEGLSKAEREMIVVATSGANNCIYCVVAHGAILRIRHKNPYIADQLATNYLKTELSPRHRLMLNYAMKVSQQADAITQADHQALLDGGFNQDELWDIGSIAALFALSNRLANMARIQPNPEFYSMGR